jgi:hypothetical protein
MDKVATQTCCPGAVHAQVEYLNPNGLSIESLISMKDPGGKEDRTLLHAMLDEWLDRRIPGHDGADHFIVFGKWPEQEA